MNNVLYILGKGITSKEVDAIKAVLSFAEINEAAYKIVDLESIEFNIVGKSMFLCFNGLFSNIGQQLIKERGYPSSSLLRGNLTDDKNKMLLFGLSGSISQYAMPHCVDEDKVILWNIIQGIKAKLIEYYPVIMGVKSIEPIEELSKDALEEEFDKGKQPVEEKVKTVAPEPIIETTDSTEMGIESNKVSVDVSQIIDSVVNDLKLSDPGLGKSLKLTDMIVLHTPNGRINIYPTNVIKEELGGVHISFKDMCSIIKMALISDAEKIDFYIKRT